LIESYLREFERWIEGTPDERREYRAELAAHLAEAESAGDLDGTIARLGSPREAAATFSRGRRRTAAPLGSRCRAAAIDYAPLIAASLALPLWRVVTDGWHNFSFTIPMPVGLVIDGRRSVAQNVVWNLVLLGAGLWAFLGLALIEARTGRTPGKRLLGLATVSEDGTAVSLQQALVRRIPVWFGPLVWLDMLTLATPRKQRIFELLAQTRVVQDRARVVTDALAEP
jgi:uncharacterized RDD family membrane protein YckC